MGTDTLPDRSNGQDIDADLLNIIKRILTIDFVPRNINGVPTTEAGGLGTETYRWGNSYIKSLIIGAAGSEKVIEENNDDVIVKFSDVEKYRFKANGLDQQISDSCGNFTDLTGDVTNLSVEITTYGRPVFIGLIDGDISNFSYIHGDYELNFYRDATQLTKIFVDTGNVVPVSSLWHIDTPSAGTYTYKLNVTNGASSPLIRYAKLIAYEL